MDNCCHSAQSVCVCVCGYVCERDVHVGANVCLSVCACVCRGTNLSWVFVW